MLGSPRIRCAVRGYEVELTPEEEVRQELVARLFALGYARDDLRAEFQVKVASERKRLDVAVFLRNVAATTRHEQKNLFIVIECKRRGISKRELRPRTLP